jgi:hypothetical protein
VAEDDVGLHRSNGRLVDAEAESRRTPEVVVHHVGPLHETFEDRLRRGRLEVERD